MSNINTPVEQGSATPEVSLGSMSLAEYRASRDAGKLGVPAAAAGAVASDDNAHAGDTDRSGESDAHEGGADDLEQAGGADDAAAGDKSKSAKKGGWQRTIDKLRRENEDLKRQVAAPAAGASAQDPRAGDSASSGLPAQAQSAEAFSKPKPELKNFDSIETFTDALTDWKADKRDYDSEQRAAQARARTETQALVDGWNSRQAEARKLHADYDEVLQSVSDVKLRPEHQRLILESEAGADIAYDLASDPEELRRFASLSPMAAARYVGKLEATSESKASAASSTNKEPRVSNAPNPARPVNGGRATGGAAATLDLTKLTLAEYRQARASGKLR